VGLMDFLRSGRTSAPPGAAMPRVDPPVTASASPVQSESQWKGFVFGARGGISRAGVRVDERTVLSLPATMQALRVLSGVFAQTPRHYYRRNETGKERLRDHPVARLLHDRPNGFQTAFQFFELALQDLMLSGNFFAWVSRDAAGRPVALTRLKPGRVVIAEYFAPSEGYTLFFDATLPDGTSGRYSSREILHIPGFTRDGLMGLNPMAYMRDAFGGAIATADFATRYFAAGAKPDVVLTTKQKVDPQTREAIRRDWKNIYGGPDGEKVAVLDQDLTSETLSHNPEEAQMLESRQFHVVELARIWGVPPHLIFDLSRATFSNIEQQSLEFITYHLGPHFTRFEQALTLAFAETDHFVEHLTDALVRGDLKSRMEATWLQRQMGLVSANEVRARENMNPIPGAAGDERWRPSNMAVAGQPVQPAPVVAPPRGGDAIAEEQEQGQ
jgi:HK97 family phage portal protein